MSDLKNLDNDHITSVSQAVEEDAQKNQGFFYLADQIPRDTHSKKILFWTRLFFLLRIFGGQRGDYSKERLLQNYQNYMTQQFPNFYERLYAYIEMSTFFPFLGGEFLDHLIEDEFPKAIELSKYDPQGEEFGNLGKFYQDSYRAPKTTYRAPKTTYFKKGGDWSNFFRLVQRNLTQRKVRNEAKKRVEKKLDGLFGTVDRKKEAKKLAEILFNVNDLAGIIAKETGIAYFLESADPTLMYSLLSLVLPRKHDLRATRRLFLNQCDNPLASLMWTQYLFGFDATDEMFDLYESRTTKFDTYWNVIQTYLAMYGATGIYKLNPQQKEELKSALQEEDEEAGKAVILKLLGQKEVFDHDSWKLDNLAWDLLQFLNHSYLASMEPKLSP